MISIADYWMGRDKQYPLAMSPSIETNAWLTVELANKLMVIANTAGIRADVVNGSVVASGWRPPAVNAATKNAAPNSKHMTGQAIDIRSLNGSLPHWALGNQQVLKDLGLWMEHPSATPTWLHVQTIPPKSGNRCFFP